MWFAGNYQHMLRNDSLHIATRSFPPALTYTPQPLMKMKIINWTPSIANKHK